MSGSARETESEIWTPTKTDFAFSEDWLNDAFDFDESPLALYDASASGSPASAIVANGVGGQISFTLASTSEAETYGVWMADNLVIDAALPFYVEFRFKVITAALTTAQRLVLGVASAMSATLDNIAKNAWFRAEASNALLYEYDDGTTDTDDQSTGFTLTTGTFASVGIERGDDGYLYYGIWDNLAQQSKLVKVAAAGLTGQVQPLALIQKDSGATTPAFVLDFMGYKGRRSY